MLLAYHAANIAARNLIQRQVVRIRTSRTIRSLTKSPLQNRLKSLFAEVVVHLGVDTAEIYARIADSCGNVVSLKRLVSVEPNEFIFNEYLGAFR